MRISDWSSDVCSSEADSRLLEHRAPAQHAGAAAAACELVAVGASAVGLPRPAVFGARGLTIDGFDGRADAVLPAGEVCADAVVAFHGVGYRPRRTRVNLRLSGRMLGKATRT